MNAKKKALGRGLDALIGHNRPATGRDGSLKNLPLESIHPGPYQPRSVMDPERLQELADSISAQGVVQPIVVRPDSQGEYEIIAGERRWRAAQLAGLDKIPAVIRDVPDDVTVAIALIENIQREDLNPLEEARALRRLLDEFDMTHQQAADAVGRSRTAVSNILRLLELNDKVKSMVDHGQLDMGHARALLALPTADQPAVAAKIVSRALSVRQTEQLVKALLSGGTKSKTTRATDPDILRLQNQLTEQLGARVSIQHQASGKGKLVIKYNSSDELEGILDHLK
jgi:ParB family chromosome partitioning protein